MCLSKLKPNKRSSPYRDESLCFVRVATYGYVAVSFESPSLKVTMTAESRTAVTSVITVWTVPSFSERQILNTTLTTQTIA